MNKRAELLQTAEKLINGDRAQSYGPPERSFNQIAKLWGAMGIRIVDGPNFDIHRKPNATDVALALVQMKVARLIASPDHEDSWVDIAGYAGLGGEISLPEMPRAAGVVTFYKSENVYLCGACENRVESEFLFDHARDVHETDKYVIKEG